MSAYLAADTYLPQGQAPRFPRGWLKIPIWHVYPPNMVGCTISGSMHPKSSARKVTPLNTITTLGNLTSKFSRDLD